MCTNFKFYFFSNLQLDTNEYICIFLASVALTVLFDAPFQNIKKILMKPASPKVTSSSSTTTPSANITKVSPTETITTNNNSINANPETCDDKTLEKTPVKHLHSD